MPTEENKLFDGRLPKDIRGAKSFTTRPRGNDFRMYDPPALEWMEWGVGGRSISTGDIPTPIPPSYKPVWAGGSCLMLGGILCVLGGAHNKMYWYDTGYSLWEPPRIELTEDVRGAGDGLLLTQVDSDGDYSTCLVICADTYLQVRTWGPNTTLLGELELEHRVDYIKEVDSNTVVVGHAEDISTVDLTFNTSPTVIDTLHSSGLGFNGHAECYGQYLITHSGNKVTRIKGLPSNMSVDQTFEGKRWSLKYTNFFPLYEGGYQSGPSIISGSRVYKYGEVGENELGVSVINPFMDFTTYTELEGGYKWYDCIVSNTKAVCSTDYACTIDGIFGGNVIFSCTPGQTARIIAGAIGSPYLSAIGVYPDGDNMPSRSGGCCSPTYRRARRGNYWYTTGFFTPAHGYSALVVKFGDGYAKGNHFDIVVIE